MRSEAGHRMELPLELRWNFDIDSDELSRERLNGIEDLLRRVLGSAGERAPFFADLRIARCFGSETLLEDAQAGGARPSLDAWESACRYVERRIAERDRVSLKSIFELHRLLLPVPGSGELRKVAVYSETGVFAVTSEVESLLEALLAAAETRQGEAESAIVKAARFYQGIKAIHPFVDANGRVAKLLADWVLGLDGYPPLVFAMPSRGHVSLLGEALPRFARGMHPVGVILNGLEESLRVLRFGLKASRAPSPRVSLSQGCFES